MITRVLRALLALLLVLALVAAGFGAWLLFGEGGARMALRSWRSPTQQLSAESVSGGLAGPLSIRGFRFENEAILLEIDRAELLWSPLPLLQGRLRVDRLDAGAVRLTFKQAAQDPPPTEPEDLVTQLPLGLDLRDIAAESLVLQLSPDEDPERFESVRLVGHWFGETVRLGRLALRHERLGDAALSGEARLRTRGLELHDLDVRLPLAVRARGRISYDADSDLTLAWDALQWPLAGEPLVRAAHGQARVQGRIDAWRAEVLARVAAQGIEGQLSAKGAGDLAHVAVEHALLQALDGTLDAHGTVAWSPQLRIEAQGEVRGINPGERWPEWPGRINATLAATTTLADDGTPSVRFEVASGESGLRGYKFGTQLDGRWRDGVLEFARLDVSSGHSRVKSRGRVLPQLDLVGELDSPVLDELVPGLAGRARATWKLRGDPARPQGEVKGTFDAIAYKGKTAQSAQLDAQVNLAGESRIRLQARGLEAGIPIDTVELRIAGPVAAHRVELQAQAQDSRAQLTASGALDLAALRWSGAIESGSIVPRGLAGWTLEEPAALAASATELDLEPACWRSDAARACARLLRQPEGMRIAMRLEDFAFAYFRSLFPEDWELTGSVSGSGYADVAGNGLADLSADFSTTGGAWSAGGRRLVEFLPGRAQALEESDGSMHLLLDMPFTLGGTRIDARLAPGGEFMERALSGAVKVTIPDLAFLRLFSTEIESAQGRIDGELRLSGTPAAPYADGRIALADGRVRLVTPGIEIESLTAQVEGSSQAGQLRLTAQATSGGGTVRAEGTLDTAAAGGRKAELTLAGENFQAAHIPDAQVWVSPDLQLRLDAEGGLQLTGQVVVPRAQITPQQFDRGVSPSRDQFIVGVDDLPENRRDPIRLTSEVEVRLGDAVHFDGFGLKTQLTGAVRVFDRPGRITSARGELRLVGGQYKAYGQDLSIESGRLLFEDGPLIDPALEIRAVRKPREDITVGIFVRGTLDKPLFNLYSTPAMPQERQLSWLVLGRSLDESGANSDDRGLLATAALSLGLTGSDYLANRFHERLGLDEISIGARPGESTDQARLTIGKYLSPKLYVSYGLGLFQPGHTFRLRYDIGRGFKLQTETGVESGGDLLYTIER